MGRKHNFWDLKHLASLLKVKFYPYCKLNTILRYYIYLYKVISKIILLLFVYSCSFLQLRPMVKFTFYKHQMAICQNGMFFHSILPYFYSKRVKVDFLLIHKIISKITQADILPPKTVWLQPQFSYHLPQIHLNKII